MVMECVGHHRKRPNPSDTDYYEPCQNTPEDNHDACSLPNVLEFTVAMRDGAMATPFAKSRVGNSTRGAQRSVVPIWIVDASGGVARRCRHALAASKANGRHGRVCHSVRSVFPGISAMTRVAQQHGSKGIADQRSSPNPCPRPKCWWASL